MKMSEMMKVVLKQHVLHGRHDDVVESTSCLIPSALHKSLS